MYVFEMHGKIRFGLSFIRILELVALAAVAVCPFWAMVAVKRQLKAVRHQRESSLADDWNIGYVAMFEFCSSWLMFARIFYLFLSWANSVIPFSLLKNIFWYRNQNMAHFAGVFHPKTLPNISLAFFLQRISSHFWWEKQRQLRLWQVALLGSFSTAMDAIDLFGTRTGPACNA